ncbi:fructose-specific PTS transporter subunit EIIC [Paenibacillus thiaminolyticus]|uniref:Fructose-specific PTS transporter subunit EIIC n=1 Tax=Paenibacillus thiaminolyticus TaxID=49283 RepID=A0AAP9DWS1_PANTH|nr:PTS fructose transporter subunit IIABC [Paenibacillus thiaminolyticus]MCY9535219.1 fructose-specific PTS transporter subunit EIIC [Paenibacillus thiaminolyticus]MCY9602480.1 fructose-specific PTS transporter subunit EIIC [Paenibacillus thiaminolyticus]MCY9606132.1 fructose-specific PTS transporter subunit EIIC [Paenibacillus thiaminolyticus]MCY9612517.1 fructose-specific PTS transporter subunit EIIC [Paenibacillus thiaminolyticus]MCY9620854.1 fructose-specific PTS transporter subunit EIIC [
MRITDLLKQDTVILDLHSTGKEAVIDELIAKLDEAGRLSDPKAFREAIMLRESHSTTGLGDGVAIPHAKTVAVKGPAICFGRSVEGVDFESLDEQPAHLFFMIAATDDAHDTHVETLSRLFTLLDENMREAMLKATSVEQLLSIVDQRENEVLAEQASSEASAANARPASEQDRPYLIAVTACPTGIAHTYMAADALQQKAKDMGIDIKVETNGSTGVKNGLTADDIVRATAVIVAADKQVEMNRFAGKHVVQVPVADGIRKTGQLIERALKQDAPVYRASGEKTEQKEGSGGKRGVYKHLMNGVSNMLPFVVGGGILIALSFLVGGINAEGEIAELLSMIGKAAFMFLVPILAGFIASSIGDRPAFLPGIVGGYLAAEAGAGFLGGLVAGFLAGYVVVLLKRLLQNLPQALEGIKPVLLFPLLGLLIVGILMVTVVNPPVAALNGMMTDWLNSLNGANAILLGLILGGMMAVDMGGPINKVAFTFGIAAIEAGNLGPHAAVMAGGMVPPLAIALATTFFKNKFTESERKSGVTNYVMGLSFITEGAIPFAAADPLRVLTSCILGSAIAGGLAMAFGITLPASHGGIFVIALVNKPFLYLLAILIGSIVSALTLGVWKKTVRV